MYTLMLYMFGGYILGFLSRSLGIPAIAYLIYHAIFYRAVVGPGFLSEIEFDVYYAIAYLLHAQLGRMMAWALDADHVFRLPNIYTLRDGSEHNGRFVTKVLLYRFGMGIMLACVIAACALPFEYIPFSLSILGCFITFICLVLAHLVFYFVWAFGAPMTMNKSFKRAVCPYRIGAFKQDDRTGQTDITLDATLYIAIYYIITTFAFGCTYLFMPSFWQFWTSLAIFGFFFIFIIVARVSWLRANLSYSKKAHKVTHVHVKRTKEVEFDVNEKERLVRELHKHETTEKAKGSDTSEGETPEDNSQQ
jgi:hypothetical protein